MFDRGAVETVAWETICEDWTASARETQVGPAI